MKALSRIRPAKRKGEAAKKPLTGVEWTVECPLPCDAAAEAARAERRRWKQRESRDGGVGPCGASRPRSHDAHERNYRVDRKLAA